MTKSRIASAFASAKAENRACFVAYLCAGDPDFDTSLAACRQLIESGIDVLELGVPFSDPLADGLTNQLAAQRALESGMTRQRVLELVRAIREFSEVPIVFYTYYNYELKDSLKNSQSDIIYWYGSKEMKCIKASGALFQATVKNCQLIELPGYRHSEISAYHPDEWVERAEAFFNR